MITLHSIPLENPRYNPIHDIFWAKGDMVCTFCPEETTISEGLSHIRCASKFYMNTYNDNIYCECAYCSRYVTHYKLWHMVVYENATGAFVCYSCRDGSCPTPPKELMA